MFTKILLTTIFLIKFVTCVVELNLEEELKFSVELSTLYRSIIFAAPLNGVSIKKCCPFGQFFQGDNGNLQCVNMPNTTTDLDVADPYYQTDNHFAFGLQPISKKLCDREMIIGDQVNEKLWISRQGYLLSQFVTETNVSTIEPYARYCVERDANRILALVCETGDVPLSTESVFMNKIIPICMLISVPLLFATALIYLIIPKLRNVHGETLALYAVCLGLGYLLMAYDKFTLYLDFRGIHTGIHFFVLSAFCWLLMMTADMAYHVWSYYQTPIQFQQTILIRLTIYSFIAFGVPALIVATIHSNQTQTRRPINTLAPIMIPISIILFLNFLMFVPLYKYYTKFTPRCTIKEEVKYRAKSVAWILTIVASSWTFEMVSMLWENLRLSLIAFPTLNALQGGVMVCVFILRPHYKQIIKEWWDQRKYCVPAEQDGQLEPV